MLWPVHQVLDGSLCTWGGRVRLRHVGSDRVLAVRPEGTADADENDNLSPDGGGPGGGARPNRKSSALSGSGGRPTRGASVVLQTDSGARSFEVYLTDELQSP